MAVLLSAALLAFGLTISDAPKVMGRIQAIPLHTMALSLVLASLYLGLKGLQWHRFMDTISIPITWKQLALAFAVGEMAVSLPAGIYAQNYLLRRVAGADFARSSAATTALLLIEAGVTLPLLAILGIPGMDWLRPAIVGLLSIATLSLTIVICVRPVQRWAGGFLRSKPLRLVGPEFLELVEGLYSLFRPRMLLRGTIMVAGYLLSLLTAFYLVAHGVGVTGLTFEQAVTVYLFALAVVLVLPISSHLGVVEAGGLGAMHALGYSSTQAMAALLGFRLVWTGAVWMVCIPVVVVLYRELAESEWK